MQASDAGCYTFLNVNFNNKILLGFVFTKQGVFIKNLGEATFKRNVVQVFKSG